MEKRLWELQKEIDELLKKLNLKIECLNKEMTVIKRTQSIRIANNFLWKGKDKTICIDEIRFSHYSFCKLDFEKDLLKLLQEEDVK